MPGDVVDEILRALGLERETEEEIEQRSKRNLVASQRALIPPLRRS